MSLENKALIAVLSMGQWTARKMDKKETQAVAIKHGVAVEVGSYWKSVLPFTKSLDDIHKKSGAIRTYHYKNTSEWGIEGQRILKSSHWLNDYRPTMNKLLAERQALVDIFLPQYPQLRQLARNTLNGMYNDDDYPSEEQVASKFHAAVRYLPVATSGDWRVDLADEEMEELRASLTADVQSSVGIAMRDAWSRLYDVVKHAADTLADPKKKFHDSLVVNPLDLCKLLPQLNLTDDPNLESMRQQVEAVFAAHTIETLKQPGVTRNETAAKLDDIMNKMGAFYGNN